MSWSTPADVTGAWIGNDVPDDDALIQVWIDKAEREIRHRVPDLQARIDAEAEEDPPRTDLLASAVDVASAMVTRVFRNPAGIRQENETTGPFTTSRTYGGNVPGALAMTDEDLAKLQGQTGSGAFSISMIPSSSPFAEA